MGASGRKGADRVDGQGRRSGQADKRTCGQVNEFKRADRRMSGQGRTGKQRRAGTWTGGWRTEGRTSRRGQTMVDGLPKGKTPKLTHQLI